MNVPENKYFFRKAGFFLKFYFLDFDYEKDTLLLCLRAFVPKSFYPVRNALLALLNINHPIG